MFDDDACLKKMVNDLAQIINDAVTESADMRKALNAIKKRGYGVDVSLAACIGLYKSDGSDSKQGEVTPINFEFNKDDLAFLKSLKIRIDGK